MILQELRYTMAKYITGTDFAGITFFAGGCVRDWLLDPAASLSDDIDICVELPKGGIRLAKHLLPSMQGSGYQSYPEFGTAKFRIPGLNLDFVATRREKYKKGSRHPQVYFGSRWDDVLRRDFSINALLMDIVSGEVFDLCEQGKADIAEGIIRSLGEPKQKFQEDPIRLLRALRFSLRFGFSIESRTYHAMQSEGRAISQLSAKCISAEVQKLLHYCPQETVQQELEKLGWHRIRKLMEGFAEQPA